VCPYTAQPGVKASFEQRACMLCKDGRTMSMSASCSDCWVRARVPGCPPLTLILNTRNSLFGTFNQSQLKYAYTIAALKIVKYNVELQTVEFSASGDATFNLGMEVKASIDQWAEKTKTFPQFKARSCALSRWLPLAFVCARALTRLS
jgi:hypothetical protein